MSSPSGLLAWRRRVRLNRAYRALFDSVDGALVLQDLLQRGGVLATSVTGAGADDVHFREGRRSLALDILSELRWSEMEVLQLAREKTGEQLSTFDEE
jgi:hypothetical protein